MELWRDAQDAACRVDHSTMDEKMGDINRTFSHTSFIRLEINVLNFLRGRLYFTGEQSTSALQAYPCILKNVAVQHVLDEEHEIMIQRCC